MKRLFFAVSALLFTVSAAFGLELQRPKNAWTCIAFPMISSTTAMNVSGEAANIGVRYSTYSQGNSTFSAFTQYTTSACVELGSTGIYSLNLSAAVMNNDFIVLTATDSKSLTQNILINTYLTNNIPAYTQTGMTSQGVTTARAAYLDNINHYVSSITYTDAQTLPWNAATKVVTGVSGNVTGSVGSVTGAVGSVTGAVGSVTGNVGGNVTGSVGSVTGAVGSVTGSVGSVTGAVTVGTNNDKTGYALAAGQQVTVSSFTSAAQTDVQEVFIGQGFTTTVAGRIDAAISTRSTLTAQNVWEYATRTLSDYSGVWSVATRALTDKANFSLAQAFPTNFASLAITVGGAVTAGTVSDKTGYTVSTVSDKTGYSLAAGQQVTVSSFTSVAQGDVAETLTGQGLTTTRAGYLDNLDAAVSTRGTSTLTAQNVWDYNVSAYALGTAAGGYLVNAATRAISGTGATAQQVWEYGTRELTSAGANGATAQEVWEYAARSVNSPVTVSSFTAAAQTDVKEVLDGQGLTTTAAGRLDAAVSSRSSHSAADVWAVVARTITGGTITTNNDKTGYTASTVSDKTGYSLAAGQQVTVSSMTSVAQGDVQEVVTGIGYTAARAGYLDKLNFAGSISTLTAQQVWEYATRTLSDYSGVWSVATRALTEKDGFSLTQSFPANFASMAITGAGAVTAGTVGDKTGYSISGTKTTLDALNDITAASVWAVTTRAITGGTVDTVTNPVTASITLTQDDYDAITGGVLNATAANYNTAGTIGNKINSAASAGDPWGTEVSSTTYSDSDSAGYKFWQVWLNRLRR